MQYVIKLSIDQVNQIGLSLGRFPHDEVRALLDNLQEQVNAQNAANIAKEKQAVIDEYLAAQAAATAGAESKAPADLTTDKPAKIQASIAVSDPVGLAS